MTKSNTQNRCWGLALEGPDPVAALHWFAEQIWPGRTPHQLTVRYKAQRPKADWLERMTTGGKEDVAAYFTTDSSESLVAHPSGVVAAHFPSHPDVNEARRWLEGAPFEVASFSTLYDAWSTIDENYRAPGFGRRHFPHGWGCAFKGAGHERLVSRRWLAFGPWVLTRGKGDLSLVQFHAFNTTANKALKQAKPGHMTMGITDEGGFLQNAYVFKTSLAGLYDAKEEILRVVVLGRDLAPVELRDARAAVKQGALTATQPLKRVAYVFPKPADANLYLHALWLRELECWTVIDGIEKRLDLAYEPQPVAPTWAP